MKKSIALLACCGILFLGACGNDNDEVTNPPDNATSENDTTNNSNNSTDTNNTTDSNNSGTTTDQSSTISFYQFDLDVEYDDFKSFEVEYDYDDDGMEAKIKDELNNRKLSGDEAFQEMQSRFEQFKFDSSTAKDDVINEVLQSFDLSDNYNSFELEIKFGDGTEKEYIVVK